MGLFRKLFNPDIQPIDKATQTAIRSSDDLIDASRRLENVIDRMIKDQRRALGRSFDNAERRPH